jgi:hypothetical protein
VVARPRNHHPCVRSGNPADQVENDKVSRDVLSTAEKIAIALALDRPEWLREEAAVHKDQAKPIDRDRR